jgi:hypothetical protein
LSRLKGFLSKDVIPVPWSPKPFRRERENHRSAEQTIAWGEIDPTRSKTRLVWRQRTRASASARDDRILRFTMTGAFAATQVSVWSDSEGSGAEASKVAISR